MALNNVPLSGQTLGQTRSPINNNFNIIAAAFVVDHVDYQLPTQGKHNKVTMPVQVAIPATTAIDMALYTKQSVLTTQPEAFFRRQNNGVEIEFTSGLHNPISFTSIVGWTRLPSGILLKWGAGSANAGASSFLFPVAATIPVFATNPMVQITPMSNISATYDVYLTSATTTTINYFNTSGGVVSFMYFAIGT